ncbi:hypothetical protein CC2G_003098 [Coprinopsis cinerea AmutBmut pab1-1]|nr:hypothetical protein CC2G_003098 [Coprinopsis cinerea AmutBmut pab1-1]
MQLASSKQAPDVIGSSSHIGRCEGQTSCMESGVLSTLRNWSTHLRPLVQDTSLIAASVLTKVGRWRPCLWLAPTPLSASDLGGILLVSLAFPFQTLPCLNSSPSVLTLSNLLTWFLLDTCPSDLKFRRHRLIGRDGVDPQKAHDNPLLYTSRNGIIDLFKIQTRSTRSSLEQNPGFKRPDRCQYRMLYVSGLECTRVIRVETCA